MARSPSATSLARFDGRWRDAWKFLATSRSCRLMLSLCSMRVLHAAKLADGNAFAGGLQFFVADGFVLA